MTFATNVATAALETVRPNPAADGLTVVVLATLCIPLAVGKKRRPVLFGVAAIFLLAAGLTVLSGCNSSSPSTTAPPPTTTPSGQYTITVTATSGSLTRTALFQLTVQ